MALQSTEKDKWLEAINSEMTALRENETWELVPKPEGKTVLPNKFILKLKRHTDGTVDKYKARLVVLGCNQQESDYDKIYSPVLDFTMVRIALTIAGKLKAHVHQMDVSSAFLHGKLSEDVYMQQPKHFEDNLKPNFVCKLQKSMYGLKQAPRVWYVHLNNIMTRLGFTKMHHAESAWVRNKNGSKIFILSYVDDMLLISNNDSLLRKTKEEIKGQLNIKDLGPLKEFLGVRIGRKRDGKLYLSKDLFISKLLREFDMQNCKPVSTTIDPSSYKELTEKVCPTKSEEMEMSKIRYREAIGSLLYLSTRTRPDISVAVVLLSRHVCNPRPIHWKAVKRIMRYLQGTNSVALNLDAKNLTLYAHADSDWGGTSDRHSISGIAIFLGGALIQWKSSKQTCIALSSTEAEYVCLSTTALEITWLRSLLSEMGFTQEKSTKIYQDNIGSITWAEDISNFKRNKHIDIRLHHVRELVQKGTIKIEPIHTSEMLADCLTKPLYGPKLRSIMNHLQISNMTPSGRDNVNHKSESSITTSQDPEGVMNKDH